MAKGTTSVRFPEQLAVELDRRAAALGLTRTEFIVRAVERALEERSNWSPAFRKAIGTFRPELEEAAGEMMDAIRLARTRGARPKL
jgi:metal-responsive CopG/Arc/MetJ family transcriptional regulator